MANRPLPNTMHACIKTQRRRVIPCAGLLLCVLSAAASAAGAVDPPPDALFGWDQRSPAPATPSNTSDMARSPASTGELSPMLSASVMTVLHAHDIETTFVEVETHGKRFWIASPLIPFPIGKRVQFSPGSAIKVDNFESLSLLRSFERVYFVPELLPVD